MISRRSQEFVADLLAEQVALAELVVGFAFGLVFELFDELVSAVDVGLLPLAVVAVVVGESELVVVALDTDIVDTVATRAFDLGRPHNHLHY